MKCAFVIAMHADIDTFPTDQIDPEKNDVEFRERTIKQSGDKVKDLYLLPGFEYEHPDAYKFVQFGAAVPIDDDCKAACADISPEEMAKRQKEYEATTLGIHDKADRDLFKKDVIAGYEKLPDGSMAYIKGKMWDAYFGKSKDTAVPKRDLGI